MWNGSENKYLYFVTTDRKKATKKKTNMNLVALWMIKKKHRELYTLTRHSTNV